MSDNSKHRYYEDLTGREVIGQVMPWNEVYAHVQGLKGLRAIFVRTLRMQDLLFMMGVVSLIRQIFPSLGELPLFILDEERGLRSFGHAAQRKLVLEYLHLVGRPHFGRMPLLPVDVHSLGLSPMQQLWFHGAYGLTDESLAVCVNALLSDPELLATSQSTAAMYRSTTSPQPPVAAPTTATATATASSLHRIPNFQSNEDLVRALRQVHLLGLSACADSGNGTSAQSLIRHIVTLLPQDGNYDLIGKPLPIRMVGAPWTPRSIVNGAEDVDFGSFLRGLLEFRKAGQIGVKIAIGATVVLDEFASGRMLQHIREECKRLEDWFHDADSMMFRIKSYREMSHHHIPGAEPHLGSYLSGKVVTNRHEFHDELVDLAGCHDVVKALSRLSLLVSHLYDPCLRLEMLQHILGLNNQFDLEQITGVLHFAREVTTLALSERFQHASSGQLPSSPEVFSTLTPEEELSLAQARLKGEDAVEQWWRQETLILTAGDGGKVAAV
eukprot:TRINITY_DN26388_c0_g1_i1.p1 TRINITY_DN26388_c0_g1~~TRINITY_DN26388_c0_g1_i1.p1  ORF type:complete len:582 (-),score=74.97 TRINITY_DN26388_c0_g1_i1:63-1553(-)